jgi:hypothetical protein
VLKHVHREVVVLGDAVERADERDEREREPEAEEECTVPTGEIRTAAPTEAQRRLREEERSERD